MKGSLTFHLSFKYKRRAAPEQDYWLSMAFISGYSLWALLKSFIRKWHALKRYCKYKKKFESNQPYHRIMFPSDILATWKLTLVLLDEASWPCNKSNPFFESICISTQLFTAIYFTFMFVSTKLLASNEHVTREDFSGFKDFLNFFSNIVSFVSFRPVLFLAPFALCPAACLTNKGYEGLKQMFNITLIQNCICSPQNTCAHTCVC